MKNTDINIQREVLWVVTPFRLADGTLTLSGARGSVVDEAVCYKLLNVYRIVKLKMWPGPSKELGVH
jgi:hypothetical protein